MSCRNTPTGRMRSRARSSCCSRRDGMSVTSRPWAGPLQRALRAELDRAVAELAVARGSITAEQLAEAVVDAEQSGTEIVAALLRRGWLDEDALASLRKS